MKGLFETILDKGNLVGTSISSAAKDSISRKLAESLREITNKYEWNEPRYDGDYSSLYIQPDSEDEKGYLDFQDMEDKILKVLKDKNIKRDIIGSKKSSRPGRGCKQHAYYIYTPSKEQICIININYDEFYNKYDDQFNTIDLSLREVRIDFNPIKSGSNIEIFKSIFK